MNAYRALAVGVYLYLAAAAAFASQPFNSCTFSIDAEGFIVVDDELGERRFFPLATFFYPAVSPELGGGGLTIDDHYADFNGWGGNCVISPWDIARWPSRPGALFDASGTCDDHLRSAYFAHCKLIADPTLFWGKDGFWYHSGRTVNDAEREGWFNDFKGWVEASYADAFLGYWQWHEPAWRFLNRAVPPPPIPTASYLVAAYNHLVNTLEFNAGARHGVFMGQDGRVIVQELWRDYSPASDCSGGAIYPCPAPSKLYNDPERDYYLPNYYTSVVGDLADVVHEAARANFPIPPAPTRNQPYIAILQGDIASQADCSQAEYRFMMYDAVIHGAKGIAFYDDQGGENAGDWYWPARAQFLPVLFNFATIENQYGLLTADYTSPLVRVITKHEGAEVERSAFVGGKLVPKSHFLSSERVMEGCAKIKDGTTYLIVACRAKPFIQPPPPPYEVEFTPYFSAYDYLNRWAGPVTQLIIDGPDVPRPVTNGAWIDWFYPGEVKIYYFEEPAPWEPLGE